MKTRKMNPARFVVGERVQYVNHVTSEDLGMLEITSANDDWVMASRFFDGDVKFKFHTDGRASWSSNLSIQKVS